MKSFVLVTICLAITCLVECFPHRPNNHRIHDCDSGHPADVIFILDASNSIWRPDFTRQIEFVKEISRMFRIGPQNTQVAVITYADYPQFQFHLNDYSTKSDILAAIDGIRQLGGYHTATPDALRYMRERGFSESNGARSNVTRVAVVITDGKSDYPVKTAAEAKRVKDAGIHLFAVGVGLDLDTQELEDIASSPSKYYMFTVEGYSGLENIKDLLAIKACSVTDPPTTTTTTTQPTTTIITNKKGTNDEEEHGRGSHHKSGGHTFEENEFGRNSHHKSGGRGRGNEMDGLENGKEIEQGRRRKVGTSDSSDTDENTAENEKTRGRHGKTGHDDTNKHRNTGTDNDDSETGIETKTKHSATRVPQINFASRPPGFESDYMEYVDEFGNVQWRRKTKNWTDVRQNGNMEHEERGNKTQEATGYGSPDYPVLPVEGIPEGFHSRTNHSRKGKTDKSGDSKTRNLTTPKKISACRPKTPLDVVFVVDSKTGDRRSHRQILEAVRHIVEQMDMDDGQMRVQFVHSCTRTDHLLRNGRTPFARSLPVDLVGEVTASAPSQTSDLFQTMTAKLTANGKPGRKKVGVYLTNGPSGDLEKTLEAVQTAKNVHEVEMFSVGLGKDVSPVELKAIASCEVAKHMFTLRNQQQHSKTKEILKNLARSLCSVR